MTSYSIDPNPEDIGLFDAKSKQNAFFIRNWTYLLNLEYVKSRSVRRSGCVILTSILNCQRDNDVTIPEMESAIRIIISISLPQTKVGDKTSRTGLSVRCIISRYGEPPQCSVVLFPFTMSTFCSGHVRFHNPNMSVFRPHENLSKRETGDVL